MKRKPRWRLTAFVTLGGDCLWRPVLELSQGYQTYGKAIAAGRKLVESDLRDAVIQVDTRQSRGRRNKPALLGGNS